jgi:hypothetical protein
MLLPCVIDDSQFVEGLMAMPRTPINRPSEEEADDVEDVGGIIDPTLLPPG